MQPNAFEREKSRVAFVHVEHFRVDAERAERFHSADAEHDLLAHPHFQIAAVKLRRDQTIFGVVLRRVGIEQIKIDRGRPGVARSWRTLRGREFAQR